jgi:hypothetical protein
MFTGNWHAACVLIWLVACCLKLMSLLPFLFEFNQLLLENFSSMPISSISSNIPNCRKIFKFNNWHTVLLEMMTKFLTVTFFLWNALLVHVHVHDVHDHVHIHFMVTLIFLRQLQTEYKNSVSGILLKRYFSGRQVKQKPHLSFYLMMLIGFIWCTR